MLDEADPQSQRWARSAPLIPIGGSNASVMRILRWMGGQPLWAIMAEALALTVFIGTLDFLTGPDYAWSIFYVAPILLATWFVSWRAGAAWSAMSAAVWAALDLLGRTYSSPFVPAWNAVVRLAFFAMITALVEGTKRGIAREQRLSRTDSLTGVANGRSFEDRLDYSLSYLRRSGRPVTVAYVDLDDFKSVNDRLGHFEGDALLRTVASAVASRLRATDTVARLGGDEFGILLPDTDSGAALLVLEDVVKAVNDAVSERWPVGMTIGAVTFHEPPSDVDAMVAAADHLMYAGKRAGKGHIGHAVWPGTGDEAGFEAYPDASGSPLTAG